MSSMRTTLLADNVDTVRHNWFEKYVELKVTDIGEDLDYPNNLFVH